MAFRCRIPVRFGEVDHAKILYYPRHLHYCHVAMEEMFASVVGVPYHEAIEREKVGYPTVRVVAEYRRPVGFGETVEMRVSVERIGHRSVGFRYEGHRASDGELAFVVQNVQVAIHMDHWRSIAIPEHHRRAFETLLDDPGAV
jgi:4-hydroxybenzoyl-CoA thioesterase